MNATEANQLCLFPEPAPPPEVYEGSPDSYEPGHPWYYLLGGRRLDPAEIEPAVGVLSLERLPKKPEKRREVLRKMRNETAADLQKDIDRYQELCRRGFEALGRFDQMMNEDTPRLGVASALALKHSHIRYNRGRLLEIDRVIQEDGKGDTP
jgi:hypothetical protein